MTDRKLRALAQFGFGPSVMKQTKICSHCLSAVTGVEDTCPNCGAELTAKTLFDGYRELHDRCEHCGTVLTSDGRYCPHCGKSLPARERVGDAADTDGGA